MLISQREATADDVACLGDGSEWLTRLKRVAGVWNR